MAEASRLDFASCVLTELLDEDIPLFLRLVVFGLLTFVRVVHIVLCIIGIASPSWRGSFLPKLSWNRISLPDERSLCTSPVNLKVDLLFGLPDGTHPNIVQCDLKGDPRPPKTSDPS